MRSPSRFIWGSLAVAVLASNSTSWYAQVCVVATGFVVTVVGAVMDYRLRRLAIEKVPAARVPDLMATMIGTSGTDSALDAE
jgi:hypothetical protein